MPFVLPAPVRTLLAPVGLRELQGRIAGRLGPAIVALARLYRATLARNVTAIAVVGSYGKTTTTFATITALGHRPTSLTVMNRLAFVARNLLLTPPWARHRVIEVAISRFGQMAEQARLLRPDIVVVTSVGSEHNRSLRTLANTRTEKAKIVAALPAGGIAILNGDDSNVRWMASQTQARTIYYGFETHNHVHASDLSFDWPNGMEFTLHLGNRSRQIQTRLLGRQMVYPVLAAATVAHVLGLDPDVVHERLRAMVPVHSRMQTVPLANGAYLIRDEFKSALETIHCALDALAEVPARRRIVIIGEVSEPPGSMGPIYRDIGRRLGEVADVVIVIGNNFQRYAAGARAAGWSTEQWHRPKHDLMGAAAVVRDLLRKGDVVLVKGRLSQRLSRVSLALMGRQVRCALETCNLRRYSCDTCPMLERGWDGK